jgi:hypothetical protein
LILPGEAGAKYSCSKGSRLAGYSITLSISLNSSVCTFTGYIRSAGLAASVLAVSFAASCPQAIKNNAMADVMIIRFIMMFFIVF